MNAQCPRCGSGLRPDCENSFACGSVLYVDGILKGTFREGMRCTSLQLGRAKSRVTELEARCKRLETAARDLYLDCIASGARWTKQQIKHMHALRDVLESKP